MNIKSNSNNPSNEINNDELKSNLIETKSKKPFSIDEIPNEIHGVKISETSKELLSDGKYSELLENMNYEGNSLKNAKIKLSRDDKGDVCIDYVFQQERLVIPEKIGNYKLTKKDKKALLDGEKIGPITADRQDLFIQVDPELNSIIVQSANQIDAGQLFQNKFEKNGHFEIGGYSLSKEELNYLCSGKQFPMKLYEVNGNHFVAKVSLTNDRLGLKFTDVKSIQPEQVQELKDKFNKPDLPVSKNDLIESITQIADKSLTKNQDKNIANDNSINPSKLNLDRNFDQEFQTALEKKDFIKLETLHQEGYKPSEKAFEHFTNDKTISVEDKFKASQIFAVKPDNFKHASVTEKPISLIVDKTPDFTKDNFSVFEKHMKSFDIVKLQELQSNGFMPTIDNLRELSVNLSEEQKSVVATIFDVKPSEINNSVDSVVKIADNLLDENLDKSTKNDLTKGSEKTNFKNINADDDNSPENKKRSNLAQKAEKGVNIAFSNN